MLSAIKKNLPSDVVICSAAVSDFKILNYKNQKIKKDKKTILNLEKNIDILSYLSNHNYLRPKLVIGFAAETESVIENAKKKLSKKHCDWIIANDVSKSGIGFNSDFNEISIIYKDKKKEMDFISKRSKTEIAENITDKIIQNFIN